VTFSGGFELRGAHGDETRLLVHGETGYAIAIPGSPQAIAPSSESPTYGVLLRLADAPIEVGLRMDVLDTAIPVENLIAPMGLAYAQSRAADVGDLRLEELWGRMRPSGMKAAVGVNYRLRGGDERAMEYLSIVGNVVGGRTYALHLTIRYRRGETTPFAWSNVRTAILSHQTWKADDLPSTQIWPSTTWFVPRSAKFELTEQAFAAARAKADEIDAISQGDVDTLADILLAAVNNDSEPEYPWHPMSSSHLAGKLSAAIPSSVVDILMRDIDKVQSMHDFRGWAWQCYWAVGNRAALKNKPT
jgi:hypothetical protein